VPTARRLVASRDYDVILETSVFRVVAFGN